MNLQSKLGIRRDRTGVLVALALAVAGVAPPQVERPGEPRGAADLHAEVDLGPGGGNRVSRGAVQHHLGFDLWMAGAAAAPEQSQAADKRERAVHG